eukprot:GFUD01006736.1.p1 GENE.GFUD01006736.1~~GFUD01006736.1.p1  ORF type:complete len:1636 (+),score=540.21 GFUD01006736.1:158-5065(+)
MGVPKFYRWLSERYPCLSEVVKEYQIPEFDNLYLDMNGIVHICSHPNDDDPHFRITEEKIFQDIFHYIEVLFRMIQPRKVFFMAIDGVAPRAKMNQQRGRRFRSAKEADMNEKKAKDRGEKLPEEERFDSNCITPGTPFMVRLQEQLKYFVNNKITTDGLWRGTKVILSGHETPGEGEHKIMDYIRYEKSLAGYDPNTRHCLYGLDADLLMLGLCTHDPHFSLLREEVRFGGKKSQANKRTPTPEETTFHLLHLSLLREYLDYEFQELKKLDFYNIENIIDDWVLMGFLVGNDFIPHLPHMHINKGALPELYQTYKSVLPTLGGFINEGGILNLKRFEKFMLKLSESELEKFDDIYSDSKWLEGKTAKKTNGKTVVDRTPGPSNVYEMLEGKEEPGVIQPVEGRQVSTDLQKLMDSTAEFDSTDEEDMGDEELFSGSTRGDFYQMEFRQHKRDYYVHKLGYTQVTPAVLKEQAEGYVRAIQWNLHYYYNGCMSWSWYYPHHFSPWITDIRDFTSMDLTFEMSKPFLPFEQLLAVLPAASKKLVPPPLQWLMTAKESEIIDYYPVDFEQDLNGKQQDWEAVVLIPFISESRLLSAMTPIYPKLNQDEASRNTHGPMWVGNYMVEDMGQYLAPAHFPNIEKSHCRFDLVHREEWEVPIHKLNKGLMAGVKLDVFFPGFPTLNHIRHTARLAKTGVRVFEQTSRGENMMLTLQEQGRPEVREVARALLGSEVWVGWPHLVEAKVVAVQSCKVYIDKNGERQVVGQDNRHGDGQTFPKLCQHIKTQYSSRYGVEVGEVMIMVHALPMSGRKFVVGADKGRITLEKQWHNIHQPYALQAIVKDIMVEDKQYKMYSTVEELFPQHTTAFMLGQPHYGAQGQVIKIDPEHKGRIQLKFEVGEEPDMTDVMAKQAVMTERYEPGFRAAQKLGISSHILSRVTGTIYIVRGAREQQSDSVSKTNIGLNLKFNKRSEEVCGFTKKIEDGQWLYSRGCVDILRDYQQKFYEVFEYIASSNNASNDMFHELDVFPGENGLERVAELVSWLENLPTHTAMRQPFGTQTLDETVIKEMEELVVGGRRKEVVMQVRPHLLYLPNQLAGSSLVEPGTVFSLFDRVVNVREGFSVPLGLRGSIIRIQKGNKMEDNLYDVVFDEAFTGGLSLRCSNGRGYRLPGSALINITFKEGGSRREQGNDGGKVKPRAVVRPYDGRDESEGHGGSRRGNVWNNRSKNAPTAYGHPQPRGEDAGSTNQMFPPPPQNLPRPPGFMQEGGSGGFHAGPNFPQRGGGGRGGRGQRARGRDQGPVQILRRGEQKDESGGNFQDIWQALQSGGESESSHGVAAGSRAAPAVAGTAASVTDMENSLKALLNISGGSAAAQAKLPAQASAAATSNPLLDLVTPQSHCKTLMTQMASSGRGLPRYDYISDPTTGLVAAQVTLDDGNMFHSPLPSRDREEASEGAARAALEGMGLLPLERSNSGSKGRGRGKRGRGRGSEQENKYQPWAQYSGQEEVVHVQQVERRKQEKGNNQVKAGTDQMDIRFRNNGEKPQQQQQQPPPTGKPAFVPLQVSRKAVKSKEKVEGVPEEEMVPRLEEVQGEVVKAGAATEGKGVASKESTPQKGQGRGAGAARRKPRIAANFGGVAPQ